MAKLLVFLWAMLGFNQSYGASQTSKPLPPFKIYAHRTSKNKKRSLQPIQTLPTYICYGNQAKKSLPKVEITFSLTCPHCHIVLEKLKDLKSMAEEGKILLLLYPVISNYVDYLMLYLSSRSGHYEQSIMDFLKNQTEWLPEDLDANDSQKKEKIHQSLCSCYSQNHHISIKECLGIINDDGGKDQLWVNALSTYLQHARNVARPLGENKEILELPAIMVLKKRVKNIDEARVVLQQHFKDQKG